MDDGKSKEAVRAERGEVARVGERGERGRRVINDGIMMERKAGCAGMMVGVQTQTRDLRPETLELVGHCPVMTIT